MSVKVSGASSNNLAEVDSSNNLLVNPPQNANLAGFTTHALERDAGTLSGSRLIVKPDVSMTRRTMVGEDSLAFYDSFPGAALNSTVWTSIVSTMTTSVGSDFLTLNNGSSIATTTYALVKTYRSFPCFMAFPTTFQCRMSLASAAVSNNLCEWGLGIAVTNATPTDGAFFRLNATGALLCVVNNNGTEVSAPLSGSILTNIGTVVNAYKIEVLHKLVNFWINDQLAASIATPNNAGSSTQSQQLPVFFRTVNTAVTATAQKMLIGGCIVYFSDMKIDRQWPIAVSGMGGHISQGQAGATLGSTQNYANSANPTATTPTNTTAALGSGLGGQYWSTTTLAVNTDGIVSSYQLPAGSSTVPGKGAYITGMRISSVVVGANISGGPLVLQWGLAYGHTAVSLATAEGATSKAPRRKSLGFQTFVNGANVGVAANDIVVTFATAIFVQPGEFIQTFYKNIGTVGSAGTIAHSIDFDGFWE